MTYWLKRAKVELERGVRDIQAFMDKVGSAFHKSEITDEEYARLQKSFENAKKAISDFIQTFDEIVTEPFEKK